MVVFVLDVNFVLVLVLELVYNDVLWLYNLEGLVVGSLIGLIKLVRGFRFVYVKIFIDVVDRLGVRFLWWMLLVESVDFMDLGFYDVVEVFG